MQRSITAARTCIITHLFEPENAAAMSSENAKQQRTQPPRSTLVRPHTILAMESTHHDEASSRNTITTAITNHRCNAQAATAENAAAPHASAPRRSSRSTTAEERRQRRRSDHPSFHISRAAKGGRRVWELTLILEREHFATCQATIGQSNWSIGQH